MQKIILSAKNISKKYSYHGVETNILNGISIDFYEGDFTVIMGPSGAGKSTLLYGISGMDKITAGSVFYKNRELTKSKEKEMAKLRGTDFGFVFQQANLVSNLTLKENIYIALSRGKGSKGRVEELLEQMNLKEAENRMPCECSGGEGGRAAIARAVVNYPTILFADEPTGALNRKNTIEVLNLFGRLHKEGQSIIMVTHDVHAAIRGNRILYLEDGVIRGEKQLGKYDQEAAKEREEEVTKWLSSMEW